MKLRLQAYRLLASVEALVEPSVEALVVGVAVAASAGELALFSEYPSFSRLLSDHELMKDTNTSRLPLPAELHPAP